MTKVDDLLKTRAGRALLFRRAHGKGIAPRDLVLRKENPDQKFLERLEELERQVAELEAKEQELKEKLEKE